MVAPASCDPPTSTRIGMPASFGPFEPILTETSTSVAERSPFTANRPDSLSLDRIIRVPGCRCNGPRPKSRPGRSGIQDRHRDGDEEPKPAPSTLQVLRSSARQDRVSRRRAGCRAPCRRVIDRGRLAPSHPVRPSPPTRTVERPRRRPRGGGRGGGRWRASPRAGRGRRAGGRPCRRGPGVVAADRRPFFEEVVAVAFLLAGDRVDDHEGQAAGQGLGGGQAPRLADQEVGRGHLLVHRVGVADGTEGHPESDREPGARASSSALSFSFRPQIATTWAGCSGRRATPATRRSGRRRTRRPRPGWSSGRASGRTSAHLGLVLRPGEGRVDRDPATVIFEAGTPSDSRWTRVSSIATK